MSDAVAQVAAEAAPYLDAFRADPAEPDWLRARRRAALDAFAARGFPTRRDEAWRFTNIRALSAFYPPAGTELSSDHHDLSADHRLARRTHRLVFVNGRLDLAQSDRAALAPGVSLSALKHTIYDQPDLAARAFDPADAAGGQPFAALNAGLFADGFVITLAPDAVADRPIEIIHRTDSAAPVSVHTRNLLALAPNSRVTVIETFIGAGAYWTNAVTSIALGEGATLTHLQVQDEARDAVHFGLVRADIGKAATYRNIGLALGAGLSRREMLVRLGERATVDLAGAYLQRGDQDTTNVVMIDHAAPGATTRELFKGVLDERAHGAFLGTIRVREGAQQTDAKQTSRALLLSDRASIDTKPELEIFADDVKCAHGAAVGDLDKDALFYLRARGIDLDAARRLLIEAFVLDALETVEEPELREYLARHVRTWLEDAA